MRKLTLQIYTYLLPNAQLTDMGNSLYIPLKIKCTIFNFKIFYVFHICTRTLSYLISIHNSYLSSLLVLC
jgi:hypothetical protein